MDSGDHNEDYFVPTDIRARRRRLHTEAEQRRRDAIKRGFDHLLELIHPTKCDPGGSLIRMSKATILNKSISTIMWLSRLETQKRMEIETLQKKVKALKILKSTYERVSNGNSYASESHNSIITERMKLHVFQLFIENLFQSFDYCVSEVHLEELSQQIIEWVENNCKPEFLHDNMEELLKSVMDGDCNYSHSLDAQEDTSQICMHKQQQNNSAISFNQASLKLSASQEQIQKSFDPLSDQQELIYGTHSDMFNPDTYHSDTKSTALKQQQQPTCLPSYPNSKFSGCLQQSDSLDSNYPETQNAGFSSSAFYSNPPAPKAVSTSICSYHPLNNVPKDVVDPTLQLSDSYSSRFSRPEEGIVGRLRDPSNRLASSLVVNSTLPSHFQTLPPPPLQPGSLLQPQEEFICHFDQQNSQYMQSSHLNQPENMIRQQQQQQLRERPEINYANKSNFY